MDALAGPQRVRAQGWPVLFGRWVPPLLAVILTVLVLIASPHSPLAQVWLAVLPVMALVVAARRPLLGWRILLLGQVVIATWSGFTGRDSNPLILLAVWGSLPVTYAATRSTSGAQRVGVLVWSAAVAWVCWARTTDLEIVGQVLGLVGLAGVLGWSRGLLDHARLRADAQRRRAERSERETIVLQERAHIARELHDVVAHRISVIAVRCESAPHRVAGLDEAVRREFTAIAEDARTAMRELHQVLTVLPMSDVSSTGVFAGTTGCRRPSPGVTDLPEAVQRAVDAGARVDLHLDEDATDVLSASEGLTVYRVVTQALANALEHAPGSHVQVAVVLNGPEGEPQGLGRHVRVDVVNGAPDALQAPQEHAPRLAQQPSTGSGRGTGLQGMRERVTLHGGDLLAEPTATGGFHVCARLPLHQRTAV